ncbi:trehalase-like domain-containing protein [Teichococcus vastitatis]|uniref:trehalase-like domain-containing protein n=1 Tax=Teichococcus vastitatis TaxID=2307076 RepID=UPI000E707BBE|nr:trehalase-like domain-containing protein [Pseudoroseomonas vastitatis]
MTVSDRGYRPIEDYALLSNCHGCALVARDGTIDWACLERFDAPPAFSRLLDARRGGHFSIRPASDHESSRPYLPGTVVLETTFTTPGGVLRLSDFMLAPGDGNPSLVRLVAGVSGVVEVEVTYRALNGFAERFGALEISERRATD